MYPGAGQVFWRRPTACEWELESRSIAPEILHGRAVTGSVSTPAPGECATSMRHTGKPIAGDVVPPRESTPLGLPRSAIAPLVALAFLGIGAALAAAFDLHERVTAWTRAHERWELDEFVFVVVVACPALVAYSYLHVRHRRQLRSYSRLLEERVAQRTADLSHANATLTQGRAERSQLLQQILSIQELERARLARELHDQLGQVLSYILVGLRLARDENLPDSAAERLAGLSELTRETLENVRALAVSLHPSSLGHLGLAEALEQEARRIATDPALHVAIQVDGARSLPISDATQIALYRVTNAALTNAIQHADATDIRITMRHIDDRVQIIVEDDGVGFDAELALRGPVERRFGLLAMQERLDAIGGALRIRSQPGRGVTVTIEAPTDVPTEATPT